MSLVPFVHVDAPLAERAAGEHLDLDERDRHHLATVLRLGVGAPVMLADGRGGSAPAELTGSGARLRRAPLVRPAPRPRLRVAQGLPKGRKLDDIVRACTELGVDGFVPVAAARSVSRPGGAKADKAVARWTAVARAASEQARRAWRPTVAAVLPAGALAPDPGERLIVAHPGGAPLPRLLDACGDADGVLVAVGPEGGWSDAEVAAWIDRGARLAGLGPTVLRTEHAAAAALAVLAAGLGRWDEGPPPPDAYRDGS